MATFYLINTITLAGVKNLPGSLIDDTQDDVVALRAAGGLLWPSAEPLVAAAALRAQSAHVNRGANEQAMEAIMQAAVDAVQQQADQFGTAVLVAGVVTVATANIRATSEVQVTVKTPGGTMGTNHKITALTPGSPGSFVITAVDIVGVTVVADTSTVTWQVLG